MDRLFFVVTTNVRNQQKMDSTDHPDALPSRLSIHFPILFRHEKRVVERKLGSLKVNPMPREVDPIPYVH